MPFWQNRYVRGCRLVKAGGLSTGWVVRRLCVSALGWHLQAVNAGETCDLKRKRPGKMTGPLVCVVTCRSVAEQAFDCAADVILCIAQLFTDGITSATKFVASALQCALGGIGGRTADFSRSAGNIGKPQL